MLFVFTICARDILIIKIFKELTLHCTQRISLNLLSMIREIIETRANTEL